ncbi:unnamed protein product [Rodentolepis nana]|uniref:DUF3453 domain-containing protein n=1 Tax=Rodentolepis nana TaxID=102285 RepID=A0A0R3TKY9_RODNA|nr:unnamed protein product [Rodentolepis nana]
MEALVKAFKDIALDKDRRASLLADATSLGGLVLLLTKENLSTTCDVLEIFSALIDCENGSVILSRLIGLNESLIMLKSDKNLPLALSRLASDIFDVINFKKPNLESFKSARSRSKRQSYNVIIQLMGNLVMSDVKMIEEQLLSVKGIISITFQLNKLRVIVMALTTVSKELILSKVNSVCENLASQKKQSDISAHLLSRQKSTASRHGMKRSRTIRSGSTSVVDRGRDPMLKQPSLSQVVEVSETKATSQRPALPPTLKPYLSDEADVFEVDEKRGAPLPRDASLNDRGAQVTGLGGWLSDFLERTLFW